jgi:hypothetical protein
VQPRHWQRNTQCTLSRFLLGAEHGDKLVFMSTSPRHQGLNEILQVEKVCFRDSSTEASLSPCSQSKLLHGDPLLLLRCRNSKFVSPRCGVRLYNKRLQHRRLADVLHHNVQPVSVSSRARCCNHVVRYRDPLTESGLPRVTYLIQSIEKQRSELSAAHLW